MILIIIVIFIKEIIFDAVIWARKQSSQTSFMELCYKLNWDKNTWTSEKDLRVIYEAFYSYFQQGKGLLSEILKEIGVLS